MSKQRRIGGPDAVLVVGGGFLGSHIARGFVQRSIPTTVLTRTQPSSDVQRHTAGARIVAGDAADPDVVARVLDGVSHVVWTAGGLLPADSNLFPIKDVTTALPPLLTTLSRLAANGGGHLTFISSGGTVYGAPSVLPVPETHQTHPTTSYGIMKLAAEHYLSLYEDLHGVRGLALRCGNVYGPGQRPGRSQGLVASALARTIAREPVVVFGDGGAVRDYVHVDDAADVVCTLVARPSTPRVINLGSGIGTSVSDLLDIVRTVTGRPVPVEYQPARLGDLRNVVLDVTLLRSLIAFEPISLSEGIERTWFSLAQSDQIAR